MAVMNVFITIGGVTLVVIVAAVVILVPDAVLTARSYAMSPQAQMEEDLDDKGNIKGQK